jgi:hypothetical protein
MSNPAGTSNISRGKTLTVLTRIWVSVPKQAEPPKRAALTCVASTSGAKRIGVHWAMVGGTHPFFFDVATHVGKLIKLHGQASRSQITRRMTEAWGDRSTLELWVVAVDQREGDGVASTPAPQEQLAL